MKEHNELIKETYHIDNKEIIIICRLEQQVSYNFLAGSIKNRFTKLN